MVELSKIIYIIIEDLFKNHQRNVIYLSQRYHITTKKFLDIYQQVIGELSDNVWIFVG